MFFGSYEHNLDEKGRLVIPRKMREELGVKFFILKGFDGALSMYKSTDFERLVERINSLSFNKKAARDYARIQLASVCELDVDKQGRAQIPSSLLSKYHIGKEVIVIGAGDHIEVWDKKAYEDYESHMDAFEEIAELIDKEEK